MDCQHIVIRASLQQCVKVNYSETKEGLDSAGYKLVLFLYAVKEMFPIHLFFN